MSVVIFNDYGTVGGQLSFSIWSSSRSQSSIRLSIALISRQA